MSTQVNVPAHAHTCHISCNTADQCDSNYSGEKRVFALHVDFKGFICWWLKCSWKFAFWPFATYYVNSCFPVAHKTTEQANIIADTTVTGANEVAQSAVEGVENAAVASGLVSLVSDETGI